MSLIQTLDGSNSLVSEIFGVAYHSRFGAIGEAVHVFIKAGLHFKVPATDIAILESGFGTGLNSWMTWLEAEKTGIRVRYLGLEYYPVTVEAAGTLNYPEHMQAPDRRQDFLQLHTAPWDTPVVLSEYFIFEKRRCRIQDFQAAAAFDIIYFDAFDPQVQPELWTEEVMSNMYAALRPTGILVTFCAQGAFRRNLKKAGFSVEKLPGIQGKWEMTRASKPLTASRV